MEYLSSKFIPFALLAILSILQVAECFSHSVPYEGDTVHVSFVVTKDEGWHYSEDGVDLVVKGPTEEQIHDARDKTSEMFEFVAHKKGVHILCFTNKSPYHETLDFDIHVGHLTYFELHDKDEHFNPLLEQISKLEEALYNIQFEQHWLEATTDRQALEHSVQTLSTVTEHSVQTYSIAYRGPNGVPILMVYLSQLLLSKYCFFPLMRCYTSCVLLQLI
ncbi:hypothetical protein MKW98_021610 [Papaver atlanticum]|uniref:GOLD domain-containing protein n=1 Tax=Papaver atlanticum TaxID=357466 RepID=A0AAD4TCS9_9MAGN|nr:hypothetical protein MKW98_021610 [Papaver atlanticum]